MGMVSEDMPGGEKPPGEPKGTYKGKSQVLACVSFICFSSSVGLPELVPESY